MRSGRVQAGSGPRMQDSAYRCKTPNHKIIAGNQETKT